MSPLEKDNPDYELINRVLESDMHLVVTVKINEDNTGTDWWVDCSKLSELPYLIEIAKDRFKRYMNGEL